ncbi:MAG TPA: hypothetical protein VMX35_08090 [Acidobacteriota bacterium]|nr:hypothetical protein [Acidobacteriota bacterium]
MRLTLINGSPRRGRSNTEFLFKLFLEGFESIEGNSSEIHYIYSKDWPERGVEVFSAAECVLLGFPLYADAMPSKVMALFESLKPLCGREGNPDILFQVQSGFPEAFHSRPVERYLARLAGKLGCRHIGTLIKGGGEGIQVMPEKFTRTLFENFRALGRCLGESGELDRALLKEVAGPERISLVGRMKLRIFVAPPVNRHFNAVLKKNGVFDQRFTRPHQA